MFHRVLVLVWSLCCWGALAVNGDSAGKKAELYDKDSPSWIPTLNMTSSKAADPSSSNLKTQRYERRKFRAEKKESFSATQSMVLLSQTQPPSPEITTSVEVQTDTTGIFIQSLVTEMQCLRTENIEMKERLVDFDNKYEPESFKDNDDKVLYYTGLQTFHILKTLFALLENYIPEKKVMSKFKMYILTLMRFRLNAPVSFLAYEFGVSQSTVSRVLVDMINVMYARMKNLVVWPKRDQLHKTMPMQFRKDFGKKVAVIIDCFEIFIDRPTNLKARAETWSSYKHHNTVKFLVGITPQGSVSFVSKAWGGRTSDKHLTEHSGFLDNILPGDIILADRGFNIAETVGSYMAEVKIPAFTKGKSQLAAVDLETSRKIAHVRIHVERVIGQIRQKYQILNGPLSTDLLSCKDGDKEAPIDKIGFICCALVNLSESVVDFE